MPTFVPETVDPRCQEPFIYKGFGSDLFTGKYARRSHPCWAASVGGAGAAATVRRSARSPRARRSGKGEEERQARPLASSFASSSAPSSCPTRAHGSLLMTRHKGDPDVAVAHTTGHPPERGAPTHSDTIAADIDMIGAIAV